MVIYFLRVGDIAPGNAGNPFFSMNKISDLIAAHSGWLLPIVVSLGFVVWWAFEARWAASSRKRNYQELKILNELREKGIITQEEFEAKKWRC